MIRFRSANPFDAYIPYGGNTDDDVLRIMRLFDFIKKTYKQNQPFWGAGITIQGNPNVPLDTLWKAGAPELMADGGINALKFVNGSAIFNIDRYGKEQLLAVFLDNKWVLTDYGQEFLYAKSGL